MEHIATAAAQGLTETLMLNTLLRTHPGVEILSRPQMRLGKGQSGFVEIGERLPVVTGLEGEVRDGKTVYLAKTEPVSLGHQLRVAPDIETSGHVTMRIGADYTAFERPVTSAGTRDGATTPLVFGSVNEHAVQATVRVTDGQTAVLRAAAPVPTAGIVIHSRKSAVKKEPTHEYLWVLTSHVVRTEQDAARVLADTARQRR